MSLLSLDVGFRATGWTVFESGKIRACGVILTDPATKKTTRNSDDNAFRAARIALELKGICETYAVQGVVGEMPSGGAQSARAMAHMALATGCVAATFSILGLPVEWTTPNEVKIAVCGVRAASKDDIMTAIKKRFDFDFPKSKVVFEHIADSCGAYLAMRNGNLVKLYG